MSFNLDDPLAGILSDGSDDSFFDDDILGKKKPVRKKSTPIAEKKNALFDLGDGDATKPKVSDEKKDSLFDLGLADVKKTAIVADKPKLDSSKSPSSFKRTLSRESLKITDKQDYSKSPAKSKISSIDRLDILGEVAEAKKETPKPLEKGRSSQSLLDDILGGSKTAGQNQSRPTTAAKGQGFDLDTILAKSESKQTVASTKPASQKPAPKAYHSQKDIATQKKSSDDWLGIFGNKDADNDDDDTDMPAWLGGDSKKKKYVDSKKETSNQPAAKETLKTLEKGSDEKESKMFQERYEKVHTEHEPVVNVSEQLVKVPSFQGSTEDITAEGAALYIQQQESQLMVALQLKAQEEKLAAMQMRQKDTQRVHHEAARAQHTQLDAMLRRQAEQRRQMQAIISGHQERITQRIKALLGTANNIDGEDNYNSNDDEYENNPSEKKESPHLKEKRQLLQLVQSLQGNHDKEIDLMETSYRRQLAFLEVSVNQSEERMKEESDKLVKFYSEKISWLEEHHLSYKKLTEDNLNSLSEKHKVENDMLRQKHLDNVRVLQDHHAGLMENIKNAVKQEQVFIKESGSFSAELHELVSDVKESKSQCQQLVDKVEAMTENTQRETERSLHARETHVHDLIQQLKKERDNFDSEKTESREIIKTLETRLKQMTTMIEEDASALKQKKMEFEFEKATFSKQTEFAKNVLKKQDEEIKILKEDLIREHREMITKIEEEKAKAMKDTTVVAKEKASIQNLKQDLEKTKAELQGQLEEVTEDRSKLNLEMQQLHMEEQRVLAKSRDLDILAKSAIEKQCQADKKYSEAEFIQRKYEDRIRRMQEHVVSLNSREKQIAREKVALSRERLMLHNERKQAEITQQCSLCKSTQNMTYNFGQTYTLPDTLNVPVTRDYGGGNVNSAMNAIEQEMAHLMGRNFNLRHTYATGSNEEKYVNDKLVVEEQVQATQGESRAFQDYMDPKFMMLRLDVQQVLSNLDQNKKEENDEDDQENEEQ